MNRSHILSGIRLLINSKGSMTITAYIGDIAGSAYEFSNPQDLKFQMFTKTSAFTDDTICTTAIADAVMNGKPYKDSLLKWCRMFRNPKGGYGASFNNWILHVRKRQ